MAEISNGNQAQRGKHQKPRAKRLNARVDLTPMVDLAFLLITFFMLTTELRELKEIKWDKPVESPVPAPVSECQVLNILIDTADRVYTYEGQDMKTLSLTSFDPTNGIRQAIIRKAEKVKRECGVDKNGKPHPFICLIKLLPGSRYKNMIDIFDEMAITNTITYGIQDPLPGEIAEVKLREKELLARL